MQTKLQMRNARSEAAGIAAMSDRQLNAAIRRAHDECIGYARQTVAVARHVGLCLMEKKKRLGHGNFLRFVESETGLSKSSAEGYIRIAKMKPDPALNRLGIAGMLRLSAAQKKMYLDVTTSAEKPRQQMMMSITHSAPPKPTKFVSYVAADNTSRPEQQLIAQQRTVNPSNHVRQVHEAVQLLADELMSPQELWQSNDRRDVYHFEGLAAAIEYLRRLQAARPDGVAP